MRWLIAIVLLFAGAASGQMSPDQAMARLRARQAARDAATQPAKQNPVVRNHRLTPDEKAELAKEISSELAKVRADAAKEWDAALQRSSLLPRYIPASRALSDAEKRLASLPPGATREDRQRAIQSVDEAKEDANRIVEELARADAKYKAAAKPIADLVQELDAARSIDLLDGIPNPQEAAKAGDWTFRGNYLSAECIGDCAAIRLPTELPKRYAIHIVIAHGRMSNWIQIALPVGDHPSVIDVQNPEIVGASDFGIYVDPEKSESQVEVRVDGALSRWIGMDLQYDRVPTILKNGDSNALGLVFGGGTVVFSEISVLPCDSGDELAEKMLRDARPANRFRATGPTGNHSISKPATPEYHQVIPMRVR